LKNTRNNTKKLKTTKKKKKEKGGFDSLEATPRERINIKGSSRTRKKTLRGLRPLRRKPSATQQRQGGSIHQKQH
jgi:hypothetical protein